MAELSDRAKQLLEAQRQRYMASLGDRHEYFSEQWRRAQEGDAGELLEEVHKIAGSAGLHGLDELQSLAAQVETAIRDGQAPSQYQVLMEGFLRALQP